ncbi:hypothetical protein EMIHUDRAFT_228888 [Emiliania huxleyi CCMP1516]|uniref:Uncharacterized protein n=2 Tax=Emiliania huxleyi TaxID=2903 RepID=A0A0D3KE51_EMIH1|nr:hypothetical protein EMIHUDRAFT_228888 [Emiliania huxleyi CCMP1516]EOD34036.1 hypothetical protein EMIHUDRAFT_228888 [Emiliania huxleyi CCMP1516]|eukprot:XP_005786465.1 hypothetical protein EMIHUDRAFT_228888 [Emiliania huxleyi CCMP1516]
MTALQVLQEAAGTNTDRTVYGAASASASSFVVHHTQQISKAAVAGDAENMKSRRATKERTDWINKQKNKQASDKRLLVLGPSGGKVSFQRVHASDAMRVTNCLGLAAGTLEAKYAYTASRAWAVKRDHAPSQDSAALNCASPLTGKAAKWVSTGRTLWQQSAAHV